MKKLFVFISIIAVTIVALLSVSANAIDEQVEINNIIYEYSTEPVVGFNEPTGIDFGEHYVATKNTFSETPETLTVVDEINGIKVKGVVSGAIPEDIKRVYLSNNIEYLGDYTFHERQNIEELTLPLNLKFMGYECFSQMTKLKKLIFPEGITKIPSYVAYGCSNLESVVLKGDVTAIWYSAFSRCT